MGYFAAIKITDIDGNVVELGDVSELLEGIQDQLKLMNMHLAKTSGLEIDTEDID